MAEGRGHFWAEQRQARGGFGQPAGGTAQAHCSQSHRRFWGPPDKELEKDRVGE